MRNESLLLFEKDTDIFIEQKQLNYKKRWISNLIVSGYFRNFSYHCFYIGGTLDPLNHHWLLTVANFEACISCFLLLLRIKVFEVQQQGISF